MFGGLNLGEECVVELIRFDLLFGRRGLVCTMRKLAECGEFD